MATAFRATSAGYRADLAAHERRVLSSLCADVIRILEDRGEQAEPGARGDHSGAGEGAGQDAAEPVARGSLDASTFAHFSAELAGLDAPGSATAPQDPALLRLLPDGADDPEEASQLRRLSEGSLRASKTADLRVARMALESSPVALTDDQAPIFGRALNAVRLVLAARLGIETQADADAVHERVTQRHRGSSGHRGAGGHRGSGRVGRGHRDQDDGAEDFMAEIYTFITWLQEGLFQAMVEALPDEDEGGAAQ